MSIMKLLKTQPPIPVTDPPETIRKRYTYWRVRIMGGMMLGYATFYIVRKNLSIAMPVLFKEFGFTKAEFGGILTIFSVVYGFSKFFSGMLADRANPRFFMAIGLIASAIANIFFGISGSLITFGLFWIINGYFQGMGWPPCARLLTFWYSPTELGTKWGIWNASHQIGGAGIMVLGAYLIEHYGWRHAFFVPAGIAVVVTVFLILLLRDTPESLGLPPIEEYRGDVSRGCVENSSASFKEILFEHVLKNKYVWIVSLANCFVYAVRIGMLDWAPTFLKEAKGSTLAGAGIKTAAFELAGIVGAIFAGWLSDTIFKGKRGPVNFLFMLASSICMVALWRVPAGHPYLDAFILFMAGFMIYGPQMLVGVAAADFATKEAAATATGMTGTFGYIGSAISGVGTGLIVDKFGWNGGFIFFVIMAVIGMVLFAFTWSHRSPLLEKCHANSSK